MHDLVLFVVAALLLAMTPGPDTAYILARSGQRGWGGGYRAVLGIALGICVHILAAATGISALLLASATAFSVAKLVGAAYLLFLGVRMLFSKGGETHSRAVKPMATNTGIFWQGFLTNVLNPKVAIFFLAFLPKFIDTDARSKAGAFLFLGALFNLIGSAWNLLVARVAAHAASRITAHHRVRVWMDRAIGGLFLFVGLRLATAER